MDSGVNTNYVLLIVGVIAISIIILMGIVLVTNFQTNSEAGEVQTFIVTDVTVDRVCPLGEDITDADVTVEYNDGTGYTTLTETTDYTEGTTSVTVLASAMS